MTYQWPDKRYWGVNGTCDVSNDPSKASCFDRGTCIHDRFASYSVCSCNRFYNPLTFCNDTIFHEYLGRDIFVPIVSYSISILLLLSFGIEGFIDLRKEGKPAIRKPAFITKALLFLAALVQISADALYHYSSNHRTANYAVPFHLLEAIFLLLVIFAYFLLTIAWFGMILRAKNLGEKSSSIKRTQFFLYVVFVITGPLFLIITIVNSLGGSGIMSTVVLIMESLIIACAFFSSTYYLIVIGLWLRSLPKERRETKGVKKIVQKNWWLGINNACLIFFIVPLLSLPNFLPMALPDVRLSTTLAMKFLLWLPMILMFCFLQNYALYGGFCKSYYHTLIGKKISLSSQTTTPSSTPSSAPSSTRQYPLTPSHKESISTHTVGRESGSSDIESSKEILQTSE